MTSPILPDGTANYPLPPARNDEVRDLARVSERPGNPVVAGGGAAAVDEDTIDLRKYLHVLVQRRWTIATIILIALVLALIATFLTTPIYRSSVLIQIDRESDKVVDYKSVSPDNVGASDLKDFYQTQYELLRSRTLARRVIDQLGLRSSKTFAPAAEPSLIRDIAAGFTGLLSSSNAPDPGAAEEPDLETVFLKNLTVTPVKNSRLVRVEFDSPSPEEAAAVTNAIAENFVNTTLERRYESSAYAKSFLEERLQQTRVNLEDSERRLIAYAKEHAIITMDDKLEILMNRLKDMSKEQVTAESGRIAAEAEYQQMAREGTGRTSGVLGSPVIQKLVERQAELTAEYQEKLNIFKPGYPKMQQLKQQIDEVDRQIARESSNVGSATRATYEAKMRQEAKLTSSINAIKAEILALQDSSTEYQTLKRETDTNRQLYDGLLQRLKEVGVIAGIGTNNISIVDAAEVPRKKFKPSLKKNLAIALALGLFGGIGLALLLDTLDDTVKSTDEVERRIGAPVLSLIPWVELERGASEPADLALLPFRDAKSALAEAYRSLRTSLIFATAEGAPKVMHFCSAGPGEGKTTSACATAITFAQTGSKVLLIDCDLRNPSIHQMFRLANFNGLTNYLTGTVDPAQVAQPTEVTRLFVISSGPLPPNPVELLSSARMIELVRIAAERFDYVILDGPPVIGLADAMILANLARASLMVVESYGTRFGALEGSVKRLRSANANILGAIFVKHKRGVGGLGYGYGYGYDYHYSYTYGSSRREALTSEVTG